MKAATARLSRHIYTFWWVARGCWGLTTWGILSEDYLDNLWILSTDRSIIWEGYLAYPLQVWAHMIPWAKSQLFWCKNVPPTRISEISPIFQVKCIPPTLDITMAEAILAQHLTLQAGLMMACNSALLAGLESQPKNTKKTYHFPQADFRVSKAPNWELCANL